MLRCVSHFVPTPSTPVRRCCVRNYGRKVIWCLFFFLPLFCSLDAFCKKKCIFTSEHHTTGRITVQLFRSGLQILSFPFFRTLALQLNRTTNHTSRAERASCQPARCSFLFATSDGASECRDVSDGLRQSAVAPSGKLVPGNTRLRLHVTISRLSRQNCIFCIFYLALTNFL